MKNTFTVKVQKIGEDWVEVEQVIEIKMSNGMFILIGVHGDIVGEFTPDITFIVDGSDEYNEEMAKEDNPPFGSHSSVNQLNESFGCEYGFCSECTKAKCIGDIIVR